MKVALNLLTMSSDPSNGMEGDVYFNTSSKNLRIYNGFEWLELTPPSTDPTPFYRHTHTFDGEVYSIDVANPITFLQYNEEASVQETLPIILMDGADNAATTIDPSWKAMTLFDQGIISGDPTVTDEIYEGGSSIESEGSTVIDFGGAI